MSTDGAYAAIGSRESGSGETNRLNAVVRAIMNQMATTTIVQVKAVNGQTVNIQPLVDQVDGANNSVPHGIIHNVPVFQLQGGSGAIVITPTVGDIGIAVFAHSDISSVKRKKGQALPGSRRKFDWADAIYLGGILNMAPTTTVALTSDGQILVTTNNEMISLNAGSAQIRLVSSALVGTSGPFAAGNGWTGTFATGDSRTVTVLNGIVTKVM